MNCVFKDNQRSCQYCAMACHIDEANECNDLVQKDMILDMGFIIIWIAK